MDAWYLRCFNHAIDLDVRASRKQRRPWPSRHLDRKIRHCFPRGKKWPPLKLTGLS